MGGGASRGPTAAALLPSPARLRGRGGLGPRVRGRERARGDPDRCGGTGTRPGRPGERCGRVLPVRGSAASQWKPLVVVGPVVPGGRPGVLEKQPAVRLKTVTGRNPGWSQKAHVGCFPFSGVSQGESPRPRGNRHPCEGSRRRWGTPVRCVVASRTGALRAVISSGCSGKLP